MTKKNLVALALSQRREGRPVLFSTLRLWPPCPGKLAPTSGLVFGSFRSTRTRFGGKHLRAELKTHREIGLSNRRAESASSEKCPSYGDDTVERVGDDAAPDTETQQADAPTKADEPAATKQATKYNCRLFDLVSGAPVAGATVTIQRRLSGGGKPFEQWPTKRESDCTTDAEGRYTVDIRPDEAAERKLYVEIRTKHPDYVDYYGGYSYAMITKNRTMGSKPFFTSIGVWPAVKIMGTVVTPDGKPAARFMTVFLMDITSASIGRL